MLRALSPKEEMDSRKQTFKRLRPGMLISMSVADESGGPVCRYFLAQRRLSPTSWSLLPLDRKNKNLILSSKPANRFIVKNLEDMGALNIHEPD
jgi:hypothetical protein